MRQAKEFLPHAAIQTDFTQAIDHDNALEPRSGAPLLQPSDIADCGDDGQLKRERKDNGLYAPCEPHHSWNTNHIVSNLLLFHLQRHSDHHANPMRPYQALRNFKDFLQLPSGYPGSFALAAIPPLWFKVMNPKVLNWADGDMKRVNTG